jgi:hypothetical protein
MEAFALNRGVIEDPSDEGWMGAGEEGKVTSHFFHLID